MKFWKNRYKLSAEEKKQKNKERLLVILSGVLIGISFPPFPFPFQLLAFFAFIPLFYVIESREKLIDINRAVYLFGLVFNVITIYWVGSWQPKADPFLMISGALLVFVNPTIFLVPSTLYYFSRNIFSKKISIYLLPVFWITAEYIYMLTDWSFPWLTIGNSLSVFISFIQIAELIGVIGLSLIVLLVNVFMLRAFIGYQTSKRIFSLSLVIAVLLFATVLTYGIVRLDNYELSNKKVKVGIVQPNLDPWDKWQGSSVMDLTNQYFELSQKTIDAGAEIVFWPETALPVYLMSPNYRNVVDSIYSFVNRNEVTILTGMPDIIYHNKDIPDDAKYSKSGDFYYSTYNAILQFSPGTRKLQRYGKMKLVPFGERVPFVDQFPFLGELIKWGVGLSGWNVGKDKIVFKVPLSISKENDEQIDTLNINGAVCYESIYPYFIADFVNHGANLIAVVTNDSWYGNSSGPYQHKEFAVLRAVENRKSVIRAANGGVSCIIDPLGRTIEETEMFTRAIISGDVIIQQDETFFTNNPLIIPILSSAFTLWVLGIFILKKLKIKFKL